MSSARSRNGRILFGNEMQEDDASWLVKLWDCTCGRGSEVNWGHSARILVVLSCAAPRPAPPSAPLAAMQTPVCEPGTAKSSSTMYLY